MDRTFEVNTISIKSSRRQTEFSTMKLVLLSVSGSRFYKMKISIKEIEGECVMAFHDDLWYIGNMVDMPATHTRISARSRRGKTPQRV